jgi:ABC-type Mn2+/Zn2+ transport system permease subunit
MRANLLLLVSVGVDRLQDSVPVLNLVLGRALAVQQAEGQQEVLVNLVCLLTVILVLERSRLEKLDQNTAVVLQISPGWRRKLFPE